MPRAPLVWFATGPFRPWVLAVFLCLSMLLGSARAQAVTVRPIRRYSTAEGLSQSQVTALAQDEKGYVWVGTLLGGLNRLDGVTVRTDYNESIGDKSVASVVVWGHRLWVATNTQVLSVDETGKVRPEPTEAGKYVGLYVSSCTLYSLVDTRRGPQVYRWSGTGWSPFGPSLPLQTNATALVVDSKEQVWVGTRSLGLVQVKAGGFEPVPELSNPAINAIALRADDTLWLAADDGIYSWAPGQKPSAYPLPKNDPATAIYQTQNGLVYVGTEESGLYVRFPNGHWEHYLVNPPGRSEERIRCFLEDRWGNLWIGVDGGGVTVFPPLKITSFVKSDGVEIAFSITELERDQILLGGSWGFSLFDKRTNQLTNLAENCPSEKQLCALRNIRPVYYNKEQDLFLIGTIEGLYRASLSPPYPLERVAIPTPEPTKRIKIFTRFHPYQGGVLFKTDYGLFWYKDGLVQPFNLQVGLAIGDRVESINVDTDDNVYVQTKDNDVIRRDARSGKLESIGAKIKAYTDTVQYAAVDDRNRAWFSGHKALVVMEPGKEPTLVEGFRTRENINTFFVYSARDQSTWVGTNRGLLHIQDYKVVRHYDSHDGLVMEEANSNAVLEDSAGDMWFGIDASVAWWRRSITEHASQTQPPIYLEDLRVYDNKLALSPPVRLAYHQNYLTFRFISPAPGSSDWITYQYILHGFEKSWSATQYNTVRYTNLPPGDYTLEVKATNRFGMQSAQTAKLPLIITPPFWQTAWFRLALGSFALGLVVLYGKLATRRIKLKSAYLEQVIAERTLQMQAQLRSIEELKAKFETLSAVDELTGLYNRRFFFDRLRQETARVSRPAGGRILGLLLLDIDHFKHTNDTYGHMAGDLVLRQLAKILTQNARKNDVVARFGGEEFVICCEVKEPQDLHCIAERIRTAVQGHPFVLDTGQSIHKTVSIGGALYAFPNTDASAALNLADTMLYRAKESGRNRVAIHRMGEPLPPTLSPPSD